MAAAIMQRETADEFLTSHGTRWDATGRGFAPRLLGELQLGQQLLDLATTKKQDQVFASNLLDALSEEQLAALAADRAGDSFLLDLPRHVQPADIRGFSLGRLNTNALQKLAAALAKAHNAQSGNLQVQVITFETGGAPALDKAGTRFAGEGARGHTAISIGDLLFSFDERGWAAEGSLSNYLARQDRDGIGQNLKMPRREAEAIEAGIIGKLGSGLYLIDGRVCTDATAQGLRAAIEGLDAHANPQRLKFQLEAAGVVESTIVYPKDKAKGFDPRKAKLELVKTIATKANVTTDDAEVAIDAYNANAADQEEIRRLLRPLVNRIPDFEVALVLGATVKSDGATLTGLVDKVAALPPVTRTLETLKRFRNLVGDAFDNVYITTIEPHIDHIGDLHTQVVWAIKLHAGSPLRGRIIDRLFSGWVTDGNAQDVVTLFHDNPNHQTELSLHVKSGYDSLSVFSRSQKAIIKPILR